MGREKMLKLTPPRTDGGTQRMACCRSLRILPRRISPRSNTSCAVAFMTSRLPQEFLRDQNNPVGLETEFLLEAP